MNVHGILAELREERRRIDEAILAIQGLAGGQKRRGRKPKWMTDAVAAADGQQKKKRRMSPEGRKRISEAARKRWAAFKKQKASA